MLLCNWTAESSRICDFIGYFLPLLQLSFVFFILYGTEHLQLGFKLARIPGERVIRASAIQVM